jgi:hypothetical protein
MPLAIALVSANHVVAPDISLNKSEDLAKNNSESHWVDDIINDIAAAFNTGTLALENA